MRRVWLIGLTLALAVVVGCASTSPFATKKSDLKSLAGVWEEEWPGQTEKDKYRIDIDGQTITITPLTRTEEQAVKSTVFQHKRLLFTLLLDGSPVDYDLVLIHAKLLTGRAKGGARNFDEPVRWYKTQ